MSSRPASIVVLHGALGSASQLSVVGAALGEVAPATVLEFPGHGATRRGGVAFTIEGFAGWLEGQLAPGAGSSGARTIAFGYSMGGYVALALEARRPGTFAGIVTLGTKFRWTPEGAARERARLDVRVIREKVPRFAAELEARHAGAGGWEDVLTGTARLLDELGAHPLLDDHAFARIACPVTVAVGSADDTVSAEEAAEVAALMQRARAVVLDGVPHPIEKMPVAEVRDLVASLCGGPR